MKKIAAISLAVILCSSFAYAEQAPAQKPAPQAEKQAWKTTPVDWDFLQIMFFPGFPSYPDDSLVCGVKIGLPFSDGKGEVCGLETAAFSAMTDKIKGVQLSPLFNLSKNMKGAQFSAANVATERCNGAQFGVVNYSKKDGVQFGLLNFMDNGFLPFFPLINFGL